MVTYNIEQAKKEGLIIGKNVSFIDTPNFGSEPYLISIGDNTTVSFDVAFVNHDGGTRVIRNLPNQNKETVIYGKITIGNNCFIGCRTTILPNVKIGDNTIIGMGSVVIRNVDNTVTVAGNPSRVLERK